MPPSPAERYTGVGSRKSHTKSKLGCGSCKRRRIKCDENKPACNNCVRLSLSCDFSSVALAGSQWRSSSQPASPLSIPNEQIIYGSVESSSTPRHVPVEWGLDALELLHHFTTSTSYTLADQPTLQAFMRVTVPQIGFQHPMILHLIISISAFHLARFKEQRRVHFITQAEHHYSQALTQATAQLSQINEHNCHALYLFAALSTWRHLARGPRQGDLLLINNSSSGDEGGEQVAEWLLFFRSLKPIFEAKSDLLRNGILAPLFLAGVQIYHETASRTGEDDHIVALRTEITTLTRQHRNARAECIDGVNDVLVTLLAAVDGLSASFSGRSNLVTGMRKQPYVQGVGLWLYCLPDEFILLLQQKHPGALAIMAYFCVLLNDFSAVWVMEGWVNHILSGIYRMMLKGFQGLLTWPMEEVGWIPP